MTLPNLDVAEHLKIRYATKQCSCRHSIYLILQIVLFEWQAEAIIRAGATKMRELYYPLDQGLQFVALFRPFMMDTVDWDLTQLIA